MIALARVNTDNRLSASLATHRNRWHCVFDDRPISDPDLLGQVRRSGWNAGWRFCRNKPAIHLARCPLDQPPLPVTAMVWGTTLPHQPVILKPRPLQRNAGCILLVPLLPYRKTIAPLPTEIWTEIFVNVYYCDDKVDPTPNVRRCAEQPRRDFLLICKALTVRLNDSLTCFRL